MNEVLGQDVQAMLPYAATVVGAGVGITMESLAQRNIAPNTQTIVSKWGEIDKPSPRMRRLFGVLFAAGAGFGLANGIAWQSNPVEQTVPPSLEVVVDHSGATSLGNGLASEEISTIVSKFTDTNSVRATALIASSGQVRESKITDVSRDTPFGDAPLEQATLTALDNAKNANTNFGKSKSANAGVLAITNGNSLGNSLSVIATANANNTPVFVVNVEADGSDVATTKDLKAIASMTKGKYWDANNNNIDEVAKRVEQTLVSDKVSHKPESRLPLRVFTVALAILGMGSIYKNRRQAPFGNWAKEK